MEEDNNHPPEINSVDINNVLHTSIVYLNKKRKFQAEQLGLPVPKHKCLELDRSFTSTFDSNANPEAEDFCMCIIKEKMDGGARYDESEPESAKECNGFPGNTHYVMSVSDEAKTDAEYSKTCPYDQPSSTSVNWGGNGSKTTLYSLDSTSVTKSNADKKKLPYIGVEHNSPHHDFGLQTSLNYEEHLLEYGQHTDYNCSEYKNEGIEQSADKELEDMLYSNVVNPNNYVLSSGRWNVNQGTQPGTKKLTIDKEFEQYFSMLML